MRCLGLPGSCRGECTHLVARLHPVVHPLRVVSTRNLRDVVDYVYVIVDGACIRVLCHVNLLASSAHLPLWLHSNVLLLDELLVSWTAGRA